LLISPYPVLSKEMCDSDTKYSLSERGQTVMMV
jgi:hypothetical protein